MKIVIRLFGPEAQAAGAREITVDVPEHSLPGDILEVIGRECPALQDSLEQSRLAINHEFADEQTPIRQDDEVALIGPVSGG